MKLLAIIVLASWLLKALVQRKKTFVKAPQNLLIIAFLAVLMASQKTYIQGIQNAFSEFSKIVIVYFLMINLIINEKQLKRTIWVLILCTTYLAIQGILLSKGVAIGNITFSQGVRIQGSGIFSDPNDLAMTLIIGLPFVFHLFFFERFVLKKIVLAVFGCLILYGILLTGSRGGMIGLAITTYLMVRRKTGNIVAAIITLICILGFLVIAPSYTIERLRDATSENDTGYARVMGWYNCAHIFLSNPVIGIGMNNCVEYTGNVAHNSFVHVATETGMIGLLIWMGFFYFSFKNLFKIENVAKENGEGFIQTMAGSLKVSLIGFIVCALSLSRQYNYIPYILIALSVCVFKILDSQENDARILTKDVIWIVGISFAFIVWWFTVIRIVI
jgi:O-antigen ligase